MPRSKNGYVRVPLPFAYLVACSDTIEELSAERRSLCNGLHHSQTTCSKTEIKKILEDKGVKVDVERIPWRDGVPQYQYSKEETGVLPIDDLKKSMTGSDLNLTDDEKNVLRVFSCSARNEKTQVLNHLQGGLFGFPQAGISQLWLQKLCVFEKGTFKRDQGVSRTSENNLNVSAEIYANSCVILREESEYVSIDSPTPLLFYSNQYTISQQGQSVTCTREAKPENNTMFIDRQFFETDFLPAAIEKLSEFDFSTELNNESVLYLMLFVPLLSHGEFAKLFVKKLAGSSYNPEAIAFLLKHMMVCFGGDLTFWQQNQSKIIGLTISLIVVAAIIIPVIVVFGWPVIVSALGGAFVVGLIIALAGGISAGIGRFIGGNIDDNRMFSNLMEKVETIKVEYRNDKQLNVEESDTDTEIIDLIGEGTEEDIVQFEVSDSEDVNQELVTPGSIKPDDSEENSTLSLSDVEGNSEKKQAATPGSTSSDDLEKTPVLPKSESEDDFSSSDEKLGVPGGRVYPTVFSKSEDEKEPISSEKSVSPDTPSQDTQNNSPNPND